MRKSIKRNLAYDDQKDLYYVTMHYGMRPDGSRDRCVRTFHCLDDAESTLTEFLRLRALKRTRHGGALLLAAGDLVRVLLEQICNAELLRERQKLRLHLREMLARQNERQKNIILQGEGIKQVEILKNKPEVLAAERSNLFFADGRECTAV